ncbi:MAG: DUF1788 domain-containing protein [Clostridiales bacterium]|jgi:hypothetical protein|nr:DUF1788 domain-containing protein [Clostridiales bacterium]
MENIDERLTRMELAMREPAFREEYGKTNEINYWIFDYDPADELKVRARVDNIAEKHKPGKSSMEIVKFDLYDVIIDYLRDKRPDERFLKKTYEFEERKGLEKVIDYIKERISSESIIFLTGIGKCYPLLRSHRVLNGMQQAMIKNPTILFFPGKYDGQRLMLFNEILDDNYYRAFRLV